MNKTPPTTGYGTILLVDDKPDNLRLLSNMLTEQGYKVRPATSGKLALASAQSSRPDLILLDIDMPGMDGYTVCTHLKADAQTRDIPVIFISALDEVLDKVRAFSVGGIDYITKPFQIAEVLARVETHLTLHRLRQQLHETNQTLERRVAERTAELARLNEIYACFVPHEFLNLLHKTSITEVRLGDQIQQEMTVLFADMRGFTSLSEQMTPQENFAFINDYLSRVSPVIRQHHGFIDKYIGDAIMALFPRIADDAVQAALAVQAPAPRTGRATNVWASAAGEVPGFPPRSTRPTHRRGCRAGARRDRAHQNEPDRTGARLLTWGRCYATLAADAGLIAKICQVRKGRYAVGVIPHITNTATQWAASQVPVVRGGQRECPVAKGFERRHRPCQKRGIGHVRGIAPLRRGLNPTPE